MGNMQMNDSHRLLEAGAVADSSDVRDGNSSVQWVGTTSPINPPPPLNLHLHANLGTPTTASINSQEIQQHSLEAGP